jgi:hypothetical protein
MVQTFYKSVLEDDGVAGTDQNKAWAVGLLDGLSQSKSTPIIIHNDNSANQI